MRLNHGLAIRLLRALLFTITGAGLTLAAGCDALGVVTHDLAGMRTVAAAYPGLAGQKVGIMVWADGGVMMDHPTITAEIARGLQDKIRQAADAKAKDVQNITWMKADDVIRFQENHPEMATDSATEIAVHLPVTRLIYIELSDVSLHPNDAVDLTRGEISGDLQVIEITDGKAAVAYKERSIGVVYPPKAPPEGLPNLDETVVLPKAVDAFTSELAKRFVSYEEDVQ